METTDVGGAYDVATASAPQGEKFIVAGSVQSEHSDAVNSLAYASNRDLDLIGPYDPNTTYMWPAWDRWSPAAQSQLGVVRYTANGVLDGSFGELGRAITTLPLGASASDVVVQDSGGIVVVGTTPRTARPPEPEPGEIVPFLTSVVLVRYTADGVLDTTFGDNGVVTHDIGPTTYAHSLEVDAEGKLLVTGDTGGQTRFLARLNTDGSLDQSFDDDGVLYVGGESDLAHGVYYVESNVAVHEGKILFGGWRHLLRLNPGLFTKVAWDVDWISRGA